MNSPGVIGPPITSTWIFWLVALVIVIAALGVVVIRNVIHAALSLGVCFFGVAALYVLLHAQFLAVAQVLVYVGDITVLILFALMLTRGIVSPQLGQWGAPAAAGGVIATLLCIMMIYYLQGSERFFRPQGPVTSLQALGTYGIVAQFSHQMLVDYVLPFEVASGILLMALVGAIVLAREERPDDSR